MNCEKMVIRGHLIQGIFDSYGSPHAFLQIRCLGNVGILPLGCCVKLHFPLESCLKKTLASNYVDQFFILIYIESKKKQEIFMTNLEVLRQIITATSASAADC
jgi:hypothetical protein